MTLDVQGLKGRVRRLIDEASEIQRILDDAAMTQSNGTSDAAESVPGKPIDLGLPPEILVPDPSAVADYLRAHPDLIEIVRDFALALEAEFGSEPSELRLDVQEDDYIGEKDLAFNVRVASYDTDFLDRLEHVAQRFDDRLSRSSGWLAPVSDLVPVG